MTFMSYDLILLINLHKLIKSLPVELNTLFNLRVEGLEHKSKSKYDSLCF